ncbi:MAG: gamma-glutamylcyclotransferase family protein [Actinomycetota bacterium]
MTQGASNERRLPFFVYGYLKRGGPGHYLVEASLETVEPAIATGRRVDTGADYPGIVFTSDGQDIEGELLYIKSDRFSEIARMLDDYEQVEAPDRYQRVTTLVRSGDTDVECYVYQWKGP